MARLPASFDWDGKDENNNIVADGNYSLLFHQQMLQAIKQKSRYRLLS